MPMFMTACLAIRIGLTAIRDVLRGRNSTSMESSTRWIQELSPALRFGLKNEKSRRVKTPGGCFNASAYSRPRLPARAGLRCN